MKTFFRNIFYLFFPLLGGGIVGLVIRKYIDYGSLTLPPLAPSGFIFPIAWTILYLLIGISYYLYRKNHNNNRVKIIYYVQLFLNFFWSILFFLLKWRMLSIIWIILLIIFVLYLLFLYFQEEKVCFYLLIPYLLWLLFALYLNFGVYFLN